MKDTKNNKKTPRPQDWKKGQSGNPNGRPKKGYSITEWFQGMFEANPEAKDKLGKAIYDKALKGDIAAQKIVWNYMDGMPQQKLDHTSGGKPIAILGGKTNDISEDESNGEDTIT